MKTKKALTAAERWPELWAACAPKAEEGEGAEGTVAVGVHVRGDVYVHRAQAQAQGEEGPQPEIEEDVMDGDYTEGMRFLGRLALMGPPVEYTTIGALVRLVREAEDFVDSFYQECTKRGPRDERDSLAWLAEARALVGGEPGKEST